MGCIRRFSQDLTPIHHHCIGGDDRPITFQVPGGRHGFCFRNPQDMLARVFAGQGTLIDRTVQAFKRETQPGEHFPPSRRSGGQGIGGKTMKIILTQRFLVDDSLKEI